MLDLSLDSRGFAPQAAIIVMQRDELRVNACVAATTESGVAITAERLAARPVDTFTNDERYRD